MKRRKFITTCFLGSLAVQALLLLPSGALFASASEETELRSKWQAMPAEKKELLLQRWKTYQGMSKEEQERLRGSLARFKALPPETQGRIEKNYDRWKSYTPEQKAAARKNFAEFKALSDKEKEEMRDKAKTLPGESAK
jgi:hypothetical protein